MTAAVALAVGLIPATVHAAPQFSALTIDARNGKVLYANDIDGIRHPASLTKMMTLYLLFQDLSAGKLTMNSPITVSARCTGMAPSKLGVKAGQSITAETATRALVVKSANDIACAVAETLGGTESAFAQRMTRTARGLGMSRTLFLNASGLPNPRQVTSARDMATLGLRLMRDYPQYYPYFRTRSFVYQGKTIKGHNRLLGAYEGTDGIKTGYVAASGFNLVTSVRRGEKRLVGVVLGGKSGASRDAYMKQMLSKYFDDATNGGTIAAYAGSSKGAKSTDETQTASAEDAAEAATTKPARKETAAKRLPA
ncbi:MAG: D-alanyl-D-alanine carboxypeptidase family protein, partial [Aestuariivirga sp.]|uniref:D-alanyl-D-alanine carboxypeptidase family protein n=1 Tax=Aestuariivirga sp. TaxID=2650926 RepID=UPI0030185CA2